jgi:hypothetical protein
MKTGLRNDTLFIKIIAPVVPSIYLHQENVKHDQLQTSPVHCCEYHHNEI